MKRCVVPPNAKEGIKQLSANTKVRGKIYQYEVKLSDDAYKILGFMGIMIKILAQ